MMRSVTRCGVLVATLIALSSLAFAQANGKLQIHFMNVGQGDGTLLVSPAGETVLFDNGVRNNCDLPLSYLSQLGVTGIDYHIASHYHDDHIGCTQEVLAPHPLRKEAIDRGGSYTTKTYGKYVQAVGTKRRTATQGERITLDAGSAHPVFIDIVALNANGLPFKNENDVSVVAVVRFGDLDVAIGGDLSGANTTRYRDIETSVAPLVGEIEVYKVHHHGSEYSTNDEWLRQTRPLLGIISAESGHGHPSTGAMNRLHAAGVKTYWTTAGDGALPVIGWDIVGGNIILEAVPGSVTFTVTHSGFLTDAYSVKGAPAVAPLPASAALLYAWSKRSDVYHYSQCTYVANISPQNLEQGNTAPPDKRLHQGCPRR